MADTLPPASRCRRLRGVVCGAWLGASHQLALAEASLAGDSALLIAPTGGGKTLAGFLGSLVDLSRGVRTRPALHTLYIRR